MRFAAPVLVLLAAAGAAHGARTDVTEGKASSVVKVIIYDDLQCSDCARFRQMLDEKLLPKYGSKVAFIHRDFPLAKHDWARQAAIAGRWVHEQDPELGITFRRELLAEQNSVTPQNLTHWLTEFAARNHLDQKGITDSLSDQRLATLVDQDRQAAVARGITRTPTVYVGGVSFVENIIYEDIARTIDEALAP
jgi:protein-disulfide isomerase